LNSGQFSTVSRVEIAGNGYRQTVFHESYELGAKPPGAADVPHRALAAVLVQPKALGAAGGLTTDADSDINRMGGWPRVVFGRRPGFGASRVTIDPQMPGSVTFSAKLVRARVLTGPLILAWMKEYLGYTSYPPFFMV